MTALIQQIIDNPLAAAAIIGNLVLIESLLSVDNAAVLATMVLNLPITQRAKALRYGIIGAYVFRGLAMLFASILIQIWWLKFIGGAYLLYLSIRFFVDYARKDVTEEEVEEAKEEALKESNKFFNLIKGGIGTFWSTVVLIEIADLTFSIDNVFAAVAFTDNILLICVGVFIGILAMRFVAQGFVKLMEKYAFLEVSAFVVILILGLKLIWSAIAHKIPAMGLNGFLESEACDIGTSILTVAIFAVPLLTSVLFNYPKKH